MATTITNELLSLTKIGLRDVFFNELKETPQVWNKIFKEDTSDHISETEVRMAGFPAIPVWNADSGRISMDKPLIGAETLMTHTDYALGWAISHKLIREDLYKKTGPSLVQAAARSVTSTLEALCANIFTANAATDDGAALFLGTHPAMDVSLPATLSNLTNIAFSEVGVITALNLVKRTLDDRGFPCNLQPKNLIVAPDLGFAAAKVLKNSWQLYAESSAIANPIATPAAFVTHSDNVLKGAIPNIIEWPYLSLATAWYVQCTTDYLRFYWRERPWYDADKDFMTKGVANSVAFACSGGAISWRGLVSGHA